MNNFTYYSPTKLVFGKNVIDELGKAANKFGKKALLVYGKGSVLKNGSYEDVIQQLTSNNFEVFEYSGIKSNPTHTDVDKAAELGRKNNVDIIIALGGGSVIDSAKAIAVTIPVDHSCWEFYETDKLPLKAIPLINVLTLAATGTETNMFSVIQNDEKKIKTSFIHPLTYPKYAFLDPTYTMTVPQNYTAYGITDLIAHCLEVFFGKGEASLSDKFIYSIIKEAVEFGPDLLENLDNYELRAKILLASTMALNGITMIGKPRGDWGTHAIGHVLSVLYDIPHGASLSIAFPAWMKLHQDVLGERIGEVGQNIFGVGTPEKSIQAFESFFKKIGSPVRLKEAGIDSSNENEIIEYLVRNKAGGIFYTFEKDDYKKLMDYIK